MNVLAPFGNDPSPTSMTDKSESVGQGVVEGFKTTIIPKDKVNTVVHNVFVGSDTTKDYSSYGEQLSELSDSAADKKSLMTKMEVIREYDYTEAVLREVSTDVLTRNYDASQKAFFTFLTDNSKLKPIEGAINKDLYDLKIYDTLNDIIEDYLFNGQYILKLDAKINSAKDPVSKEDSSSKSTDPKKIVYELSDNLDQKEYLPAYSKSRLVKIFDARSEKLKDPSDFLVLNLFSSNKKILVESEKGSSYNTRLPKGLFSEAIIKKMNNLKLLEALQPLIELQSIDEKMYFNIRFPPGKDVNEAYSEAKNYEKLLKSILSVDSRTQNVDDIVDRVSSIKVIPLFGNQEQLNQVSVSKVNRIDLQQIQDLRDSISSSLKVNIDGNNSNNLEYYKLIRRIRSFLRISIQEFLVLYIKKKYSIEVTMNDFEVAVPEVQGAEDLDTIDYINLTQSTYKDILELIKVTNEAITELIDSPLIDKEALINSYSNKIQKLTGANIFKTYSEIDFGSLEVTDKIDQANQEDQ